MCKPRGRRRYVASRCWSDVAQLQVNGPPAGYGQPVRAPRYIAAWVPADDVADSPEAAVHLAASWVTEQARQLRTQPLLVLPEARTAKGGPEAIKRLAQQMKWTTPRARGGQAGSAVLAYVPDYKGMDLAAQRADGAALAVVAYPHPPLGGWAVERQALDLVTMEATPDDRPRELLEHLDHLDQCGNNDWTTAFDKGVVPRILASMLEVGPLDPGVILGAMLARGYSASALQHLAAFIDRV
jgi:hypothetical protein